MNLKAPWGSLPLVVGIPFAAGTGHTYVIYVFSWKYEMESFANIAVRDNLVLFDETSFLAEETREIVGIHELITAEQEETILNTLDFRAECLNEQ